MFYQKMQKLVSDIGAQSVKLEQESHKLMFKLNQADASKVEVPFVLT